MRYGVPKLRGNPKVATPPLIIRVNNQPSVAMLSFPLLGGSPADACGVLHYGANKAAVFSIGFTASQPTSPTSPSRWSEASPSHAAGNTANQRSRQHSRLAYHRYVGALLGPCSTAGVAVELYVAATINNGWSRQSEYDAEALLGFVLTS